MFFPFSFKVGFTVTQVFCWVFSLTQQHHLFVSMRQFSFEEEKKTESAPLPDLFPSAAAGTPLSASLPLAWPSSSARWHLWSGLCSSLLPAPAMQTMSVSQSFSAACTGHANDVNVTVTVILCCLHRPCKQRQCYSYCSSLLPAPAMQTMSKLQLYYSTANISSCMCYTQISWLQF